MKILKTLLDIKTFDVAGATHINAQHTDARRFATHTSVASHCVNTEYGVLPPPHAPDPAHRLDAWRLRA